MRRIFSHFRSRRWALISALVLIAPGLALSGNQSVPVAVGSIVHDSARITFEWPQEVKLAASLRGTRLSVSFERKADPDFAGVLKALYPYVRSAERKADGKTIVFTLDKPYKVRTFQSDTINGVELLNVDLAARPNTVRKIAETYAALIPAAGEEVAAPAATPAPEAPPAAAPETPATAPAVEAAAQPEVPTPPGESAEPQRPTDRVVIGVSPAEDNAILRFPFSQRAAMAVFVRARTLWIAWNVPLPADLTDFENLPRTVIGKAETVEAQGATVVRMPIDDGVYVSVKKEQNSFDWAVLVTSKKAGLEKALPVQVNTDPPTPAHVLIPALEPAEPVTVTDPRVGDQIVITPFYSPSEGIGVARNFVEFSLLESAQGLAVVKRADDVSVLLLRNGLRVTVPQGATLTPGLGGPDQKPIASASQETMTLFPYEQWKPTPEKRKEQIRALFHDIVESKNPQDANAARLRLAQVYLSDGLAAEALGFLDGVNRTNPAFYRSSKLAAMRGAANFLMYRFADAAKDFSASELNNNKEADYWRAMLADLLGNPDQDYDYLALNGDYISKYPPLFRQRLAIVAADRAVAGKDYNNALKVFDTLQADKLIDSIGPYVNFLMAKISAETGQEKEGVETWDKLAEDYSRPFVQARAEFSRILWGIEHNNLTKDEVIERLERLRLAWHGDGLELNILTMLGDLYSERKDYVNAMRIWNGGVISFPNTAAAIEMARKMQEAFINMFNGGLADALTPLEALGLYYEYRNYTPTGDVGNEIINRLADRLVSVDLLDQAAALLDRQMRFQTEKEKRSETGVRLAEIYLKNHQPAKALTALQDSVYGNNSLMLRMQRNRLTARALVDMGEFNKALLTLGQDNSVEAERIRIDVYWMQKNWAQLTTSVENLLKTRKDITAPINIEESEFLLRLALAYVFQNDRVQLQYLHDYFGPLMAKNPNREVFEFIVSGDVQLTTTNFDQVIASINNTRTFIEKYSARINTDEPIAPKVN